MAFLRSMVLGVFLTGFLAAGAWGAESSSTPLGHFFGSFKGTAIASQKFPSGSGKLDIRDLDVTIKPLEKGGFSVSWSTVFRSRKAKQAKTRSMTWNFQRTVNPKVWRGVRSGDPLVGNALIWARVDGKAMLVYVIELKPSGESAMAIYRRTVINDVMTLEFERRDDGKAVRLVRGHLKRQAK